MKRGAILSLLLLLTSCSHGSAISRQELHSLIRSFSSLASDTELALDYMREGRLTSTFATGHIQYIQNELQKDIKQLDRSTPAPGVEQAFEDSQQNVKALSSELAIISSDIAAGKDTSTEKGRIERTRIALEQTGASL